MMEITWNELDRRVPFYPTCALSFPCLCDAVTKRWGFVQSQVKQSCISPLNSHIDLELASQTVSLSPSPVATGAWSRRKTRGLWEALSSGMYLTGWAWEPVVDTEGTNYPPIIHCWQCVCVWVPGKETQRERETAERDDRRREVTARRSREKLDSVSLFSRVFDGLTVTCWMTHKRIHSDYCMCCDHPINHMMHV